MLTVTGCYVKKEKRSRRRHRRSSALASLTRMRCCLAEESTSMTCQRGRNVGWVSIGKPFEKVVRIRLPGSLLKRIVNGSSAILNYLLAKHMMPSLQATFVLRAKFNKAVS